MVVLVADDLGWRDTGIYGNTGIRTPNIDLLVASVIPSHSAYDRGLLSTVDLTPTLLEIAGGTAPEAMQGGSFRDLLTSPQSYFGARHGLQRAKLARL